MKLNKFLLIVISVLTFNFAHANEQNIDPKLALFGNFLGSWESTFEMVEGNPTVVDVTIWERALNGKAIRTLHSINDGMYGGESLIFWDKEKLEIVFYYFTTADFFTHGHIEIIDQNNFVAYEDVSGSEDGITQVKSTSTYKENTIVVSTAYLKDNAWTTPEVRVYKSTNKVVKFK